MRTIATIIFLILSLPLSAKDFDSVDPSPPWLANLAVEHVEVLLLWKSSTLGFRWYGPYLEELSKYPADQQLDVSRRVARGVGIDETDLIRNLRLPEQLIADILLEALANGADTDPDFGDIPAFQEVLFELREENGTKSGDTFSDLREFAPKTTAQISFIYGPLRINAEHAKAEAEHAKEISRAADLDRISKQQEKILGYD